MQQNQQSFPSRLWWLLTSLTLLVCSSALAQKTVVKDAGGGRSMELVYNSAGQVTEERMLDADGKVTNRTQYEYRPGFYQAQETATSYWPNGKIKVQTRTSYDANSNFTLEFVQVFDESGKQVGGHRLTHEPLVNVFRCYEWNAKVQDYQLRECPAGEEGGEGPEEAPKFTYQEVSQHLTAARTAAGLEEKKKQRRLMSPEPASSTITSREIGLVLPTQVGPGEKFSGTVVEDPKRYDDLPGVSVVRIVLPFTTTGTGSSLMDWEIVAKGEKPQQADKPVCFTLPPGLSQIAIRFQRVGEPANSVSKTVDIAQTKSKQSAPRAFKAAAVCLIGQLCVVSGPFSGDSRQTFAAFAEVPATIVAQTRTVAYVSVPDRMFPGAPSLFIAEGSKMIAFPVVLAGLTLDPGHWNVSKGQPLAINVRLDGPSDLPETAWQAGNFPASNLSQALALVPGYKVPRATRESKETREMPGPAEKKKETDDRAEKGEGGEILLVVKNQTPEIGTLRNSKNGGYVFPLHRQSFARGSFSYDFVVEPSQAGSFVLRGYAIPFLAPVTGQEFPVNPVGSGK